MEDRCVMCGEIIPEGRMVCPVCEERVLTRKGEQTMKARTIRETEYTWEQIEEILAAGKARETFGEDGQITVQVEGIGTALLNILDYDKDKAADPDMRTMTLQFADLPFDEIPFDENGCNKWEKSSIRRNMNSIAFKERFEEGFRRLLVPVLKENGDREATLDTFFLLSVEEMKDKEKKYQRFRSERDCVKVNPEQETEWCWTRSAYRETYIHSENGSRGKRKAVHGACHGTVRIYRTVEHPGNKGSSYPGNFCMRGEKRGESRRKAGCYERTGRVHRGQVFCGSSHRTRADQERK